MQFLALATSDDDFFEGLSRTEVAAGSRAEALRAWELYRDGTIREIRFRVDRRDVVILLEAPDERTAHDALATLPFVQAGAVTFDLIGLRPYDAWEGLFAPRRAGKDGGSTG